MLCIVNIVFCGINLLLTEREGRTGEYWPEVVTVRSVRTETTEGQYGPEQERLVSSLLYGIIFPPNGHFRSFHSSQLPA